MATPTPIPTPPPYTPASHLVNASSLSAAQLVSQFQDFYLSLEHISTSPALVFERLVANLLDALNPAHKLEDHQNSGTLENCYNDMKILRQKGNTPKAEPIRHQAQYPGSYGLGQNSEIVKRGPNIRNLNTIELMPKSQEKKYSKEFFFSNPYPAPPGIVVGFRCLNINNVGPIFMDTYATDIRNDGFKIHTSYLAHEEDEEGGYEGGEDLGASCSWLEVGPRDPDFQFGTFSTQEDHPLENEQSQTTRLITFPRAYAEPPQVVVWLSAFCLSRQDNCRVGTYASDITTTGFILHIDTESQGTATASWVACTAGRPNICIGNFNILGLASQHVTLRSGEFAAPPRVLLAINSFETSFRGAMILYMKIGISATGIDCRIKAASSCRLVSSGVSFIALG